MNSKQSNPKDAIGSTKLPMSLVPGTLPAFASLGFLEGACHYGRFNWRIAGVRASIYVDAAMRHLEKWYNGQEHDAKTGIPHLSSALACIGIILDARLCGKLTDDRPPAAPLADWIDEQVGLIASVKELFKDHNPRQWTIADTELTEEDVAQAQPSVSQVNGHDLPDSVADVETLYPHWEVIRGHYIMLLSEGNGTIDDVQYTGQQLIDNIEVLRAGGVIGGMEVS